MAENYIPFFVSGTPRLEVFYGKAKKDYKGCILCIPGICHGAWCFENFLADFPESGYDCYALSLRGHAGSEGYDHLDDYGLSDFVDDVKRCIEFCKSKECAYPMRSTPFLLGHSMGGAVVQKYIGDYADTVSGAILFAPATAPKMNIVKTLFDTFVFHKNLHIAANKASGKKISDEDIRNSAFFDGRVSFRNAQKYNTFLQRESRKITQKDLFRPYTHNYIVNIPILVIGSYADSYFPEKSLEHTAKFYGCSTNDTRKQLKIVPDLCHDMMLDEKGWKESANAVSAFMENNP